MARGGAKIPIRFFWFAGLLLLPLCGHAQKYQLPFDNVTSHDAMRQLYELDTIIHFSYKPLLIDKSLFDTLVANTHTRYSEKQYKRWLGRKLFYENLIRINYRELSMTIDPLMNFQGGMDLNDTSGRFLTTNTRAVLIQGNITKKVYFRTTFYETQSYFPAYVDSFIKVNKVVPGQGRAKIFKETGWDYPVVSGILNFQASRNINLQFGHDKIFIGNGYRSVLLSDNSSNYPFLQVALNFFKNKLHYTFNYASLQVLKEINDSEGTRDLFVKKTANFNYLSFKPSPIVEIGVFEGVVWERWNEENGQLPFNWWFANPVMFVNTIVAANDTSVKSNLGLNLFVKPLKKTAFYGQLSWNTESSLGYQLGIKGFDLFKGFNYFVEYNHIDAGMTGFNNRGYDYYHYNQPLTHQQVQDFDEIVARVAYRVSRILISAKYNYIATRNELLSPRFVNIYDFNAAFLFNPQTNLMFHAGFMLRQPYEERTTQYIYFGLKTNLRNLYYDF